MTFALTWMRKGEEEEDKGRTEGVRVDKKIDTSEAL
jgi:hypothetical protein